ncbi:MAG: nitrophenyl compound nitroreductase subunit ArsF family protein [Bacteroidales bacterium]|nr:nitrophenyl compound nitroreductase subunit ArsF family protein [Bacteroidales bacterium]MDD2426335.1 nitrophenyl compound nitroreductase subunit ArsF family protein [Bacteroidales bacterium]MDD3990227.1 nitrophenyl compound nitroreductase subunit ArsF family protein [Bacteroidales bacterium]MDD4639516.1 nitrophenyl compound nitroreductase subunit ArsF family protein [Bacteroidales bacterium]
MKHIILSTLTAFMVLLTSSLFAEPVITNAPNDNPPVKVDVYYFHFTARCVTCKAVEEQAKANVQSLYGEKVRFSSVNIEEESGKELAKKLKVSGQALLIVKGKKQINITNQGFMYAKSNPEKFKSIIKENIDPLL